MSENAYEDKLGKRKLDHSHTLASGANMSSFDIKLACKTHVSTHLEIIGALILFFSINLKGIR